MSHMKRLKTRFFAVAIAICIGGFIGSASAGSSAWAISAAAVSSADSVVATVADSAAVSSADSVVATVADSVAVDSVTDSAAASYVPMRPVDGVGQPVSGGWDFQPQVTEIGHQAKWMSNVLLLPIITVITLFVLALLLWVVVRYRAAANPVPSKTSHNTLIEILWTGVPVLILVFIAVPSIGLLAKQHKPAQKDATVIKVTGYQWNWGYAYPDLGIDEYISNMIAERKVAEQRGEPYMLAVDNRMVVPVGRQVKLLITGADVIHSFAVPALWVKMDAVPGRLNETSFTVEQPGVYYGQCSELCGINHGYMPIAVEALPQDEFDAWVRSRGGTPIEDTRAALQALPASAVLPDGSAASVAASGGSGSVGSSGSGVAAPLRKTNESSY